MKYIIVTWKENARMVKVPPGSRVSRASVHIVKYSYRREFVKASHLVAPCKHLIGKPIFFIEGELPDKSSNSVNGVAGLRINRPLVLPC